MHYLYVNMYTMFHPKKNLYLLFNFRKTFLFPLERFSLLSDELEHETETHIRPYCLSLLIRELTPRVLN